MDIHLIKKEKEEQFVMQIPITKKIRKFNNSYYLPIPKDISLLLKLTDDSLITAVIKRCDINAEIRETTSEME